MLAMIDEDPSEVDVTTIQMSVVLGKGKHRDMDIYNRGNKPVNSFRKDGMSQHEVIRGRGSGNWHWLTGSA